MLVFDIETTGLSYEGGARISVACTIDSVTGEESVYYFLRCAGTPEYDVLRARFLGALNSATRLCAFNGVLFDVPFIASELCVDDDVVAAWLAKLVDPFHAMRTLFRTTSSLNAMLALNGLEGKSGSGAHAVELAREGKWQELTDYCMDDVRLTLSLVLRPRLLLFEDAGVGFYMQVTATGAHFSRSEAARTDVAVGLGE